MIRWKPARNAKPPSSDDLRKALVDAEAHAAALTGEAQVIQNDMPNHLGTPRYAEAQAALANVETELAVARRTADTLQAGILAAEEREAREREAAANAEADRRHAEVQTKVVPVHQKLIREIEVDQRKLADRLAQAEALRAEIEAANAVRGHRPFIPDGEMKLRCKPGGVEPAVFEERELWLDGAGNEPYQYWGAGEDRRPIEQGYTKQRKKVQVRAERIVPPQMPPRYAETIRLFDRAGNPLTI